MGPDPAFDQDQRHGGLPTVRFDFLANVEFKVFSNIKIENVQNNVFIATCVTERLKRLFVCVGLYVASTVFQLFCDARLIIDGGRPQIPNCL